MHADVAMPSHPVFSNFIGTATRFVVAEPYAPPKGKEQVQPTLMLRSWLRDSLCKVEPKDPSNVVTIKFNFRASTDFLAVLFSPIKNSEDECLYNNEQSTDLKLFIGHFEHASSIRQEADTVLVGRRRGSRCEVIFRIPRACRLFCSAQMVFKNVEIYGVLSTPLLDATYYRRY